MGSVLGKGKISKRPSPCSKLELKMMEAMRIRAQSGTSVKSFNQIILKFHTIDKSLKKCKTIFQEFDKDSNRLIDPEELKNCLKRLEVSMTDEETEGLFEACDIRKKKGMKFNEFIVLLCLVYLLQKPSPDQTKLVIGLSELEAAFEIMVDSFVFVDKNKDGHVSKDELVEAMREGSSGQSSSDFIALERFEEMDWDKNGMVSFKEFIFSCISWIGIDDLDDIDDEENDTDKNQLS